MILCVTLSFRFGGFQLEAFPAWIRGSYECFDTPAPFLDRLNVFFNERGIKIRESQRKLQLTNFPETSTKPRKRPAPLTIESTPNSSKRNNVQDLEEFYTAPQSTVDQVSFDDAVKRMEKRKALGFRNLPLLKSKEDGTKMLSPEMVKKMIARTVRFFTRDVSKCWI